MMIVDDDDKSKKEIIKDSLLFFHISSLLRFPLVYERSLMASLNIDVDDFTYTHLLINGTADSPYPKEVSEMLGVLVIEPSPLFLLWRVLGIVCLLLSSTLGYAWIRFGL